MPNPMLLSLSALVALLPASLWSIRPSAPRPDVTFWAVMLAAVAGPAAVSLIRLDGVWQTGFSVALWLSIAASMAVFAVMALAAREAWRLAPLLLPYLLLLGILATVWSNVPGHEGLAGPTDAWLVAHIALAVTTYAMCTLAAVAGAAVLIQERAVKRKRPTPLTHRLPSVSGASRLQANLLGGSEIVLGLGILTGMAQEFLNVGQVLVFDHKILLSLLAFALIGGLLILHHRTGLRGQRAARLILLAYLLLTLAYPGVKFVSDVILG